MQTPGQNQYIVDTNYKRERERENRTTQVCCDGDNSSSKDKALSSSISEQAVATTIAYARLPVYQGKEFQEGLS